ncbi:MAG: polysaccharide deacetylase family protein [Acidobacteriota bacterium]|nr:polysaccharide deacetylase family protein [Acidobacteriota bacterium]
MITFDDAYADIVDHAFPVLEQHHFRATVFVITRWIGRRTDWDGARIMTAGAIRNWAQRSIDFGSHSRTHPDLRTLSNDELEAEVSGSREDLESVLGSEVVSFAYPSGHHDERVRAQVAKHYQLAVSTIEGLNGLTTDPSAIKRTMVQRSDILLDLQLRLRYGFNPIMRFRARAAIRTRFKRALARVMRTIRLNNDHLPGWRSGAMTNDEPTAAPTSVSAAARNTFVPRYSSSHDLDLDVAMAARLLDTEYNGRVLLRALLRKLSRKVLRRARGVEPAAVYNGLLVFDAPGLQGGGLVFEQVFHRVLHDFGLSRCDHLFEFCAGPGYIGYSLFAHGFCDKLTLSDINPAAIEVARYTARFNGIDHLVNSYVSDGLADIPPTEKWDLVIAIPPLTDEALRVPATSRPDWKIESEFYSAVKPYMRTGGHVLMLENSDLCCNFEAMIVAGGGMAVGSRFGGDVPGGERDKYFILSRW